MLFAFTAIVLLLSDSVNITEKLISSSFSNDAVPLRHLLIRNALSVSSGFSGGGITITR